ncbi:lytic polysaccharide monooxygenase auxiliary activity family 9 protein [Catenuloplanes japonicus]|uniref:lytic polysaccharide monooxygenase auxiliary activity family 9 protein n=1 Tax=Catenuloplanes japonicus TaxID=33876 RepID=UPI0005276291|nr:lytic polysaccharide monooxygenase [Catenuloplanes japonicus]
MKVLPRTLAALAAAIVVLTVGWALPAQAHGNIQNPPSRNFYCWERWGAEFQNPAMATEDPMCWQAWQADPNAMWNWNGLFREGVAGNHQGAIPDGQLCSAGRSNSGRYNALDTVGNWHATNVSNSFTAHVFDQASHGADYIRLYVTKQGFNPVTQPLTWANLELVKEIGNTPASQWNQVSGGVALDIPVSAPGRTGRHMVYTIWQASHLDQSYYWCSDVNFGGTSSPSPTATATSSPTPTPTPTATASPTPSPTGGAAGCAVTYTTASSWSGGYQGDIKVTAGSSAIKGWTVKWTLPSGQTVSQSWNATVTSSGSAVTATNASYNGALGAGASTSFGFIATGTASALTPTCAATV